MAWPQCLSPECAGVWEGGHGVSAVLSLVRGTHSTQKKRKATEGSLRIQQNQERASINSATGSRWKSAVQQGAAYVPSRAQLQEPFQWLPESFSLFYSHQSQPSPYNRRTEGLSLMTQLTFLSCSPPRPHCLWRLSPRRFISPSCGISQERSWGPSARRQTSKAARSPRSLWPESPVLV